MASLPPLYARPSHGLLVLQEEEPSEEDEPEKPRELVTTLNSIPDTPPEQATEWRFRSTSQTVNGVLFICLNIGVDPPDVDRPAACARMECWFEPDNTATQKSLSVIKGRLHEQYRKWHPTGRFKVCGDPTVVDLHKQCKSARKNAKRERVLFHYNGHGVPMPTETGEIWLFNSNYTKYIPLNLATDLQTLVGNPSLYIFDCNAAGRIINYFRTASGDVPFLGDEGNRFFHPQPQHLHAHGQQHPHDGSEIERDCIVLAACGADEKLPVDQKLPADLFTSCLTTPIRTALYCYARRSLITGVTPEMIDRMPGNIDDRNTPLGDLTRIFTTVSDTIAWNVLPRDLFKRLFRQDLLLASMMRNFLLAGRIMRFFGCTPESIPQLPESHNHPLWESFEYTIEQYLAQLPSIFRIQKAVQAEREYREQFSSKLSNEDADINGLHKATLMREESRNSGYMSSFTLYRHPMQSGYNVTSGPLLTHNLSYQPSTFFEDQIKGFEVWLDIGDESHTPQQLPILLLLLMQSNYRQKGLELLSRFLQIGRKAVEQALSIGVFPYILQHLKKASDNQSGDYVLLPELVLIWGKILAFDPKCKVDLVKISAHHCFVDFLSPVNDNDAMAPRSGVHLAVALFIVAIFGTQREYAFDCQRVGIRDICLAHVRHPDPLVRRWACLCLLQILQNGKFNDAPELLHIANDIADSALVDDVSEVRAAGVCAVAEVLYRAMHIVRNVSSAPKPLDVNLSGSYGRLLQGEYSSVNSNVEQQHQHNVAPQNYAMRMQTTPDVLNRPAEATRHSTSANHSRDPATYPEPQPHRSPHTFDAPPTRLLEHQIVEQVGRVIARMGLINTSVLVRREVAIALSHVALINPDPFVAAAIEFPGLSERILEKIRSKVPLTCYAEMWLTLIELALDPHPIVASHARSSFDMILSHAFTGNTSASDGSVSTQSDALESPFSSYPSYPIGANPASAGSTVDDIRENRRSITRHVDVVPENTNVPRTQHGVLLPTSPDDGNRAQFNDGLTVQSERPRRSLPSLFNRDGGGQVSGLDDRRAVVHVRGSSGRFNLNSVAPQGRIPRVNSASVINLNDANYPTMTGAFDDERNKIDGETMADSPKFHLGAGVMNLFSFLRPQPGGRQSQRSSGGLNGLYGPERSTDRVSSPPRIQIRSRSYQVLPPENSVGKLSVSYEQDNSDIMNNMRDMAGSSNDDRSRNYRRLLRPPVEKAVDSLFSWSCACMSRISIESNSADHLPESDPEPQYTKLWDSILRQDSEHYLGSGRGPFSFNVENATVQTREGPTGSSPSPDTPLLHERTTHAMGAGGGAVVSLAFLPREIGREGDEYIVTGDSTGSVGVYDTRSGECQSSFGIPAPPGIPDVEVRSVMCLNSSRGSSSLRAFMQHAPLIVAGSYDGRVAVFRPDLVTKKYSVLSSFQASGRSLWSNFRRNDGEKVRRTESGGSSGAARRDATLEMKTLLHSSGNGLVMDFQAFSRCLHVAGCEDNILRVWDLTREMCTWEGEVAAKSVWPTAISSPPWSSHTTVVVGASDGSVTIVDTRARSDRRVLGMHDDPIVATAYGLWTGARESIVSADCEGTVRVWDARQAGTSRCEARAHDSNLSAMAAHRAGDYVATGSTAGGVKVFRAHLAAPEEVRHRRGSSPDTTPPPAAPTPARVRLAPVTGLAFQHEPCSLAVGCSDATVTVFDVRTQ